jgi:hypothetical protein
VKASVQRFVVNESVVSAVLDDEAVLLNAESGIYYGVDAVGTRIWQLLTEGMSEDDVVNQLVDEYDVELTQLRTDVAEFLTRLHTEQLVRVVDG